jgi:hypothetical protein
LTTGDVAYPGALDETPSATAPAWNSLSSRSSSRALTVTRRSTFQFAGVKVVDGADDVWSSCPKVTVTSERGLALRTTARSSSAPPSVTARPSTVVTSTSATSSSTTSTVRAVPSPW